MKHVIYIFILFFLTSCSPFFELDDYNFDNFHGTKLEDLAMAVRADNSELVVKLVKKNNLDVDFKDPKCKMTLLALAAVNSKKNACQALLELGANPNILIGSRLDTTPFLSAIEYGEKCYLDCIEIMLKFHANPNLELKMPSENNFFGSKFPLSMAINRGDGECLDLVKLLIDKGANINYKYYSTSGEMTVSLFSDCLLTNKILTLKYLVVDLKIDVPNPVFATLEEDGITVKKYSLYEILNTEEYAFENNTELKKAKEEILTYLRKTHQE